MDAIGYLTRAQVHDYTIVAARLRSLTEEGGEHNYLILEVGPCRYIQFLSSCGSAMIYAEASSGRYCRPACNCGPTPSERMRLLRLG